MIGPGVDIAAHGSFAHAGAIGIIDKVEQPLGIGKVRQVEIIRGAGIQTGAEFREDFPGAVKDAEPPFFGGTVGDGILSAALPQGSQIVEDRLSVLREPGPGFNHSKGLSGIFGIEADLFLTDYRQDIIFQPEELGRGAKAAQFGEGVGFAVPEHHPVFPRGEPGG